MKSPVWKLRCRFDWKDKRLPWSSCWNESGPGLQDKAWAQNKTGIMRACIEAKNEVTKQVTVIAECEGWDFVNFEWLATVKVPGSGVKTMTIEGTNIGLVLITREAKLTVLFTGEMWVDPRSDGEKTIQYAGFGK